ncbi:hypothetical protein AOCH_000571 [Aspergillus ochraceoroseus]|uniref:Phospholipase/carboxylesterase/thioesterase domain-containing protein n=1 Tax=Aspergillus ochraceoroseus TaxID=138278 RepID=A0A0F8WQC7_9EURO|nr:hypothetical protein AOCH_000571 [Aspergillus ochraceoroseus]
MAFPPVHIHAPQVAHTHTVILLHGRGSNGPEFREEFFASLTSDGVNLPARFPSWRWVFPTSRERDDTRFQEPMSAWFDAYSLSDIHEHQDLQIEGLKESVSFMLDLIMAELQLLSGRPRRLFIGGISQGMATALWAFLCLPSRLREPVGGFLGFCGWLPYSQQIEDILASFMQAHARNMTEVGAKVTHLLLDLTGWPCGGANELQFHGVQTTPVLLSHGVDDAVVDIGLGQRARSILSRLGLSVEWKEYHGADNEGHWIPEPEGFDDIVRFLRVYSAADK